MPSCVCDKRIGNPFWVISFSRFVCLRAQPFSSSSSSHCPFPCSFPISFISTSPKTEIMFFTSIIFLLSWKFVLSFQSMRDRNESVFQYTGQRLLCGANTKRVRAHWLCQCQLYSQLGWIFVEFKFRLYNAHMLSPLSSLSSSSSSPFSRFLYSCLDRANTNSKL